MKIGVLSVWPGSDGADYHFQVDYKQQLEWFTEALIAVNKECLKHGIKLGIEPKPYEPRELFMVVPTAASAILVAQKVNQACGGNNCGLTIDYGHQKMEATTASTACDLADLAGVPVHKFDVNDARQGRNDQDLMFGTISIPESVEYLYTTFVRNYQGWYSQDQFTYREDPTRAIERSMINFANLSLKAVRILAQQPQLDKARARRHGPGRPGRRLARAGRIELDDNSTTPQAPENSQEQSLLWEFWELRLGSSLGVGNCGVEELTPTRVMDQRAFTIGIDYGTNSVRAVVVDTADGRFVGTRVFDYPSGEQGVLLDPKQPHLARQNPADYIEGLRVAVGGALKAADARARRSARDRVIGIGVDTTGSTPLPVDAQARPLAMDPTWQNNLAAHAWLWKDHTSAAEAAAITETAQRARAGAAGADRRHVFLRVVVVEDLALPQGRPGRLRRRGELGRAGGLHSGRAVGRRRLDEDRPLRLRRGPQGDVLARRGAACRRRRSSPGSIRSSPTCAIGSTTKRIRRRAVRPGS